MFPESKDFPCAISRPSLPFTVFRYGLAFFRPHDHHVHLGGTTPARSTSVWSPRPNEIFHFSCGSFPQTPEKSRSSCPRNVLSRMTLKTSSIFYKFLRTFAAIPPACSQVSFCLYVRPWRLIGLRLRRVQRRTSRETNNEFKIRKVSKI